MKTVEGSIGEADALEYVSEAATPQPSALVVSHRRERLREDNPVCQGVALAGPDFGADANLKASVNAVTVYFFDTCDIFEDPSGEPDGGDRDAAPDQRDQR